jgi:hypothetical protein
VLGPKEGRPLGDACTWRLGHFSFLEEQENLQMGRRVGVILLGLVAVLLVVTDSLSACRLLDRGFGRCGARRCRVARCCEPCCLVKVTCCMPAVCAPVAKEGAEAAVKEAPKETPKEAPKEVAKEAPKEVAKEAPKEVAKEAPKETPKETPTELPKEAPPVPPPVVPPAKPPEEPAVQPPVQPTEKPAEPPAAQPPAKPTESPAEKPAQEPAVEPPAKPAESPGDQPSVVPPAKPAAEPAKKPAAKSATAPAKDPFSRIDTGGVHMWTDISGQYHLQARFVSFEDGTVRLKQSDGRYYRIAFDKLSLADQALVRRQTESVATVW